VHWPLGSYALPPDELAEVQRFDVAEARALVEQVGGIRFKMIYPAETTIWEHGQHLPIFLQQMRRANIEVEEEPLIFGSWVSRFLERSYESNLALNQIYETPEIPLLAHVTEGPFGDKTYVAGLGDPEVDAAVRRCNTTIDLEERIEAVRETQRLIYSKDPLFLPLVSPYLHMAYSRKVRNIPAGVGTTNYFLSSLQWLEE
jgi:ABC-type transport system substrate-binding protein